eukprot:TRINITY_DN23832_c0_g1_i3.p1 TRINITY_DN23832_c0_g1~~TRINITY_DN23832_c0_g1_i3.p1  ORF type:complete len:190 (-),score=18.58 TRINITY_DN23832_c0_g1_i3:102-671(-)
MCIRDSINQMNSQKLQYIPQSISRKYLKLTNLCVLDAKGWMLKKYAKNLCQTCYKKQKKPEEPLSEVQENAESRSHSCNLLDKLSQISRNSAALHEWNGTCPHCGRIDAKHYAKGMCTSCYRRARKKAKQNGHPTSLFNPNESFRADSESQFRSDNQAYLTLGFWGFGCLLYTSPSPRDLSTSRMPSSA